VTDSTPWQPPAGAPQPPAPSPYAAPPASPAGALPPPTGWTPPPKPGLIPLRPLTLGTLLGAAFQVLRRNPRPTFGLALMVTGITFLVTLAVVGVVGFFAFTRTLNATGADAEAIAAGSVAMVVLSALVPVGLSIIGSAILQGVVSLEVARGTVAEKLRLGGLWRAARGRLGALIGWSLLLSLVILLGIALLAGVIALAVATGGAVGVLIGVLLGLAGAAGFIVVALWLGTKLSLVPSILMLERLSLRAALARSWALTRGFFWKTLGIQLLVVVIVQTVSSVISTPLGMLLGFSSALINPNGESGGAIAATVVIYLVTIIFSVVFGAIAAVVQSATPALIYIDIRMRREGLDLELIRFVEARQAGDTSVADPYLPHPAQPASAAGDSTASTSPWA